MRDNALVRTDGSEAGPAALPPSIREAEPADAARFLELKRGLDRESRFMLLEPGERTEREQDLALHLAEVGARDNSVVLVAEEGDVLLGYVEASGGSYRRDRHVAYVVIGVRQKAGGRGIGTALMQALSAWAVAHGVHRLELTVMAHNERAIGLYRRAGYAVEGTRRHSVRIDGADVDELWMAKLHPGPPSNRAQRP